ncbi:MAG: hypothetical protein GY870_02030 [archaeon]|nr:hypothetical protein [archaeon]
MDHQITTYSFQGGVTATLTMQGVSDFEGRELRIFGSKGTIRGIFRANYSTIDITDFRYSHTENVFESGLMVDGHGGGDFKLMDAFTAIMLGEKTPKEAGTTDIASAMESHYMAFAGEVARINGKTLNLKDFR